MPKVELVKVIATEKNKHHKTGSEITCTQEMAEHLIAKGFAESSDGSGKKKGK